jgi:hypothetical protein
VSNTAGNTRNGFSLNKLKGEFGELPIEVPSDRHCTFDPQIVEKHQTRWKGFDYKILSLHARGMTVREIQSHLQEMYGAEVSPSLVSAPTSGSSALECRGSDLIERNWRPGPTPISTGPSLKRKVPRDMFTPAASVKEKNHGAKNH